MRAVCGAARRRWCRSAGGGSRPLKATVASLYPAASPCPAPLSTCRQTRCGGRGGERRPTLRKLCRLGPAGAPGAFYGRWKRAVGSAQPSAGGADVSAVPRPPCNGCMTSALSGLERLSPSRSNSKCVAPPVGLPIAGHTSFPVKIVAARHRCAERPTPLCWRRSADPRWALLGSSIDAGAFPEAGIRFSLSEAGFSPRIGTMPDAKRRLADLVLLDR